MPPANPLPQWDDMQGLLQSSYIRLPHAAYILLRIQDNGAGRARAWLRRVVRLVTPVEKRIQRENYPDANVNIAFTFSGLEKLAASSGQQLHGFARPFVERIDGTAHRRRILGDAGGAPWDWGGHASEVDVLLMVFGRDQQAFESRLARVYPRAHLREPIQCWRVDASPRNPDEPLREHFGFVDGLSQPILTGSEEAERLPSSIHLTALGEIVLGYPNAAGATGAVPALTHCHDFGRNGSYLVLRQLEQDVARFRNFCRSSANGDLQIAEDVASKIVGRRRDGTPLVPNTSHTDNEFGYTDDAHGYGCPVGAHIRRVNPRDSFDNNNEPGRPAIEVNTHRLVRRGRPYGPPWDPQMPDKDASRGLMFLALNSDIERQFEFIQQNWINSSEFAGVSGECDPLVGNPSMRTGTRCSFTIPALPLPARLINMPRFVAARGGDYFFLPGMRALWELVA